MAGSRNCLEQALKAYKDVFKDDKIKSVFDQLEEHKQRALDTGSVLTTELMGFAKQSVENEERWLKAAQIQQLVNMQAVVDTMQVIDNFKQFGKGTNFQVVKKAIMSKLGGTQFLVKGSRKSTDVRMVQTRITFLRQFLDSLSDDAATVFFSKEHEIEIAEAINRQSKGEALPDTPIGEIGKSVRKFQEQLINSYRTVGTDITELEDRITGNVHNQARIMRIDPSERGFIGTTEQQKYQYLKNRWTKYTLPLLDKEKVFVKRGIDLEDTARMNEFMGEAFDNITNRGKVTQRNPSMSNKFKQPRVLLWKDGKSMVEYNQRFGSGAIQDSLINELQHGFANIELIKQWGNNPLTTIDRVFKLLEQDPDLKARFNKGGELDSVRRYMQSLVNPGGFQGKGGDIARAIRNWEYMTKLGSVTLSSIPDMALLTEEAARLGMPAVEEAGNVVANFTAGLNTAEKEVLADLIDSARVHQLGQFTRFFDVGNSIGENKQTIMERVNTYGDKGVRLMHKLNMLEHWDNSFRAATASMISRWLAKNRGMAWDALTETDQNVLTKYGFDKHDWNVIRKSGVKSANSKLYITPDGVQTVDESVIKEALAGKGAKKMNSARITAYRDELESQMRDYFQDRQDHVILRPDVVDREMLNFGISPDNNLARFVTNMMTLFKTYTMAYVRKPLAQMLYGKGARNFSEALFSSKADYAGIARLSLGMMGWAYASMAAKNAILGLSPPSLKSPETWASLVQEPFGLAGIVFKIDYNDFSGSLGRFIGGAPGTDLTKVLRLGRSGILDSAGQAGLIRGRKGYSASKRATWGVLNNNLPLIKQAYTIKGLNDLFLDSWQDHLSPGSRKRHLSQLKKDQGVKPFI